MERDRELSGGNRGRKGASRGRRLGPRLPSEQAGHGLEEPLGVQELREVPVKARKSQPFHGWLRIRRPSTRSNSRRLFVQMVRS